MSAELRKAIARLRKQRMASTDELDLVCAAAESTLPKTNWRVEWTNGQCLRGVLEFDAHEDALAEVRVLTNKGYTAYIWRQPREELP